MNCFTCFSTPTQLSHITITNPYHILNKYPKTNKTPINNQQIKPNKISLKKFITKTSQNDHFISTADQNIDTQTDFRAVKQASKSVLLKQNINKQQYRSRTKTVNSENVGKSILNSSDRYSSKPFKQFNHQRIRRAESMQNQNAFEFMTSIGESIILPKGKRKTLKVKESLCKSKIQLDEYIDQSQFDQIKIQIKQIPNRISKVAFCLQQKDILSSKSSINQLENSQRLKSDQTFQNNNFLKPQKSNNQMILSRISRQSAAISIQDVACIKTQSVGGSFESSDKFSEIIGTLKSVRTLVEKPCSSTNFVANRNERVQTQKQLKKTASTHQSLCEV